MATTAHGTAPAGPGPARRDPAGGGRACSPTPATRPRPWRTSPPPRASPSSSSTGTSRAKRRCTDRCSSACSTARSSSSSRTSPRGCRPAARRGRCSWSDASHPTGSGCCGATRPANRSSPSTCTTSATPRSTRPARSWSRTSRPPYVEWAAQTLFDHLVDAVLNWLDHGQETEDESFIALEAASLRATVAAWTQTFPRGT